jgi:hypothetical protein
MTINNVEFEVDFTDADLIERIDVKSKEIYQKAEELEKNKDNLSPAEGIRQECKMVKEFLDYVFGEGTSQKLFGDKNSLKECLKAFEDIINERNRQLENFKEVVNKYSPERLKK